MDISETFVEIAQRKASADRVTAQFELGNAAALPVEDGSVDFVVCRAAFKNFADPVKALVEMRRVLRPGGQALLIDMRRDVTPPELKQYVNGLGVGWLSRWLVMMVFRHSLVKRAYLGKEIGQMAAEAGWNQPRIEPTPIGFEAWMTR